MPSRALGAYVIGIDAQLIDIETDIKATLVEDAVVNAITDCFQVSSCLHKRSI